MTAAANVGLPPMAAEQIGKPHHVLALSEHLYDLRERMSDSISRLTVSPSGCFLGRLL
jgi:hypothetical protein